MKFSESLISWYATNKRDLPWRNTTNPYIIWLSEIILQQTRVEQGISYYYSFIEKFPTIEDLAEAKEAEVMKLWQGLGYYSRARNLHCTAKHIVNELNGQFPEDYPGLLKLKGVGEYTAAAIASFSYNLPFPVIDGNVYRVLSRIFGIETPIDTSIGKKRFKLLAQELIDCSNPSTYNQAIMEFGAINCTPKKPKCDDCIFQLHCEALKKQLVNDLPKKEKKLIQKNRYFNYFVIRNENNEIYLNHRKGRDIWQGLYDFPLEETINNIEEFSSLNSSLIDDNFKLIRKSEVYIHVLSHQKINATFWLIEAAPNSKIDKDFIKVKLENIGKYAVPKLIENYINTLS